MKYGLLFLILVSGCSAPVEEAQRQSSLHQSTIDFGVDPLTHEADTTVTLSIGEGADALVQLTISDPSFSVFDTARLDDSLRIWFRFVPQNVGSVSATCSVFGSTDTVARITLMGVGLPFEHRIGDSYVFLNDSTGRLDSVWVSRLPLQFATSDSTVVDQLFRSIVDHDTIWICSFFGGQYGVVQDPMPQQLQIASVSPFSVDKEWTYISDSNSPIGGSYHRYYADSRSSAHYQIDTVGMIPFLTDRISANASIYEKMRFVDFDGSENFLADYSSALGFFTSVVDSVRHQGYAASSYISETKCEALRLLRYHLKR